MTRAQLFPSVPRWRRGGLVVLSALSFCAASAVADASSTQLHASADFSQTVNGRTPARVFVTDLGVYELDTASKFLRIWQRSDDGRELLLPVGATAMRPYTEKQYQYASPRPQRFTGVDAAGNGTTFNHPAGMDKHPTADKFAVVSGGEYQEKKLLRNIPSVQVYSFSETAGADGALGSLEISLEDEFREAFFTTETGWEQVFLGYTNVVTVTVSNVVLGVSSNWVYVVSADPLVTRTNDWDSALLEANNPPPDVVYFPDEKSITPVDGLEYPILVQHVWTTATTNVEHRALYDYRPSNVTTNASYLSSATDVAFLGDAAILVPISDCGYTEVYNDRQWDTDHWVTNVYEGSGFVVFDAADPSAKGLVFPCATNLPGKIAGVCADPDTGDVYAAVPSAAAVYRFSSPGGTPASWLSLPDRTVVVQDPDFVVGVPDMPSSLFGYLSNPEDVALWRPDAGSPILLAADRANNRVMAFDPASTWTVTNWLGTGFVAKTDSYGVPVDPSLGYVVAVAGATVRTNWYRVERTAFPLFAVAPSSNPMNKPNGVFGADGEPVLAVADYAGGDVRLYGIDLSELDSEDLLSFAAFWPGRHDGFPEVSSRDFAVSTNDAGAAVARWDAPHANPSATPFFMVMESDAGSNVLEFAVEPSRFDRTYTLSVSPADGVVTVLSGTAVVPAGETAGSFSFLAKDGVVFDETEIVLWATNSAPDGTVVQFRTNEWCDAVAFAETNVWRATPLYVATVSGEGGYSTNIAFVVGNEAPTFVEATYYGYVIPGDPVFGTPPELYVFGLGATAEDVAADSDLRYLWWATSDANWAATNLQWAVTNDSWAAGATPEWTPFAGEGTPDDFCVARGLGVPFPFDYNVPNGPYVGYQGLTPGASWGTAPFVVACTVLDKDGGFSIVTFPQKTVAAAYDTDWTWSGTDMYSMPRGIEEGAAGGDAVYAARFIAVSGTNVTFVVWPASGTPGAFDTVTLQSSARLEGASDPQSANWSELRRFSVGGMAFPATNNLTPAGSGPVRFYRVVQP